MRRFLLGACSVTCLALAVSAAPGCSSDKESTFNGGGGVQSAAEYAGCIGFGCTIDEGGKPGCVGLECKQVPCEGGAKTTREADHREAGALRLREGRRARVRPRYHEVWLRKSPEPLVSGIATWADPERQPPAIGNPATTAVNADISAAFPKAIAMSEWLTKQNALSSGKLPLFDARHNVDAVGANALNWISVPNPNAVPKNTPAVQYMSFNTPVGAAEDAVCGRVVLSNLHVGAGSQGGLTDDPRGALPGRLQDDRPQRAAKGPRVHALRSVIVHLKGRRRDHPAAVTWRAT